MGIQIQTKKSLTLQEEFCKGIPILSGIQVKGNEDYAWWIRFFSKSKFANHTATYLGQGKNLIVEASPLKAFNFGYLQDQLKPGYEVKIYSNPTLTNEQIEKVKGAIYDLMASTKSYWAKGLLQWLLPINPKTQDQKYCSMGWCYEWYNGLSWRLFPVDCEIDKVAPADMDRWFESDEAKNLGWKLDRYWNKGKIEIYNK